jgi:hypothetical protein
LVTTYSDDTTITTPTGYTLIEGGTGTTATSVRYNASYKFMTSTPDTTLTLTNLSGQDHTVVTVWRNVDTTTPIDVTDTRAEATTGNPNPPAITTVTNNAMIIPVMFVDDIVGTPTPPSGYTLAVFRSVTAGGVAQSYRAQTNAGTEDPGTYSFAGNNDQYVALTIALRRSGNVPVSPTPSLTRTVTPTNTATPSITPTITATRTITPTVTRTPSITASPVNTSNVCVSGAGSANANNTYTYDGIGANGRPIYRNGLTFPSDATVNWTLTNQWEIRGDGFALVYYFSTDNVAYPWLVTTWQVSGGNSPVPTVVEGNCVAGSPSVTPTLTASRTPSITPTQTITPTLTATRTPSTSVGAPNVVTSGSLLYIDAGNTLSYPGSGTNWFDLLNNVTSSLINGPTFTSAGTTSSINLDGTNDHLLFNPSSSLTGLTSLTANMWLKIQDPGAVLFYKSDNDTSRGWFIEYGDNVNGTGNNGFGFSAVSSGANLRYYINKNQMPSGSWTNFTVTWDGTFPDTAVTAVKIYINGVQNTNTSYTQAGTSTRLPDTSADPLSFGQSRPTGTSNANFYSGSVGVLMLYDRALSAAEVTQNYNAFSSRYIGVPVSPSITPTRTVTPSITTTRTPSITATRTPSVSSAGGASVTPSITPSITATRTITPTVTRTPTVTPTRTITPTVTPTVPPAGITFVDSASTTGTSITLPTGLLQNDIVVICSMSPSTTTNLPTGYTDGQSGSSNSVRYRWAYKRMGATPDTTASGLSSNTVSIAIVFRGVNTTTLLDVTPPTRATDDRDEANPPSITTTTNNSMVVAVAFQREQLTLTAPTNFTLARTANRTTGTVAAAYRIKTPAGAENPGIFGGGADSEWVATTFALRPA